MLLEKCMAFAVDGAYDKFADLGREIGTAKASDDDKTAAEKFIAALGDICRICEIPTLEEYGIDADEMSNFKEKEGGIFYAKDSLGKSCSVAINGSDTTIDIWELKKSDSDTVIDLYKQIASSFNGAGYTVIAKTEVDQGDAHYIYIEFSSKGTDIVDTIYMTTVKNGLQYSIMYTAENMTENDENEAHSIFDTAFITKTISNTETDEQAQQRVRNATLAIIAIVILIAVVIVVAFVKHAREKKRKIDNGEYVSQFKDKE